MSFVKMTHLGLTNVITARLLLLDGPEWDASTARQSVDFPSIVQSVGAFFKAGDHASGLRRKTLEDGQGLLARYAEKCEWGKDWFLSRIPNNVAIPMTEGVTPGPIVTQDIGNLDDARLWQILFDTSYEVVV